MMDEPIAEEPLEDDEPKPIVDDEDDAATDLLSDEPIPLGQLKKKDLIEEGLEDEEEEDEEEEFIENNGMWEE